MTRVIAFTVLSLVARSVQSSGLNILHIISDDLRPEFDAYGFSHRHTPNIDRIATNATVFDRAYAQQAVCGPSRNSFMTGRRPDRSRTWNFINHFREDHPEWTTLPGLFLKAGAKALAAGKTFHPKMPPLYDAEKSWSREALPYHNPCWNTADQTHFDFQDGGLPCVFCPVDIKGRVPFLHGNTSIANEMCEIDAYEDTLSVDVAISLLRKVQGNQFFLAVGMHKPHLPFQAAPEDWVKHPLESVDLPTHSTPPQGVPGMALTFSEEENEEHTDPWHPLSDEHMRHARRGYRAALTGMDRKLGRLLDELEVLGLAEKTAIIFHGDHGYHLGEQGVWRKFTNFENGARTPLIIKVPGFGPTFRSGAMVELVDLLPTIAELAGIPLPENETFDGMSLVPVLRGEQATVKDFAFSQYPRRCTDMSKPWKDNAIHHRQRNEFTHMGYSVRTAEWRYTEWFEWNQTTFRPIWSKSAARELYDHRNCSHSVADFNVFENENIAEKSDLEAIVQSLSHRIRQQFGEEGSLAEALVV